MLRHGRLITGRDDPLFVAELYASDIDTGDLAAIDEPPAPDLGGQLEHPQTIRATDECVTSGSPGPTGWGSRIPDWLPRADELVCGQGDRRAAAGRDRGEDAGERGWAVDAGFWLSVAWLVGRVAVRAWRRGGECAGAAGMIRGRQHRALALLALRSGHRAI